MEEKKQWAWKDGWTHGRCVGFLPRTIFHKDESGNLLASKEVIFFQDWEKPEFPAWRSIEEPPVVTHPDDDAEQYDRRNVVGRYWWIRWAASMDGFVGMGGGHLIVTDELLAFIKTLGWKYQGVGTTGETPTFDPFPTGEWQSVFFDWQIKLQDELMRSQFKLKKKLATEPPPAAVEA